MYPNPFLVKNNIIFTVEKSSPNICAISVIFSKLPRVNSLPIGETLPNLVTLLNKKRIRPAKRKENPVQLFLKKMDKFFDACVNLA
jgi:hypothetical protein